MIQLIAYTQDDSTPSVLDMTDGTAVKLNLEFANPGQPLNRQSPYSGAFTLPMTPLNDRFFGHWYNVNLVSGAFNSDLRTRCEVRTDGNIITEGFLQLRNVNLTSETYQVSVLGTAGEFFARLGDATLTEILDDQATGGAADYDYSPTGANVVDSWTLTNDITEGSVGAGVVVVPFADYGNSPSGRMYYDVGSFDSISSENYLKGHQFKAAIQVKHVLDKCFAYAGMTLSSSFWADAQMAALYMLTGTASVTPPTRPFYGAKAGISSNISVSGFTSQTVENWTDTGAAFYDPDDLIDTLGFTAPIDMTATFEVSVCTNDFNNTSAQGVMTVAVGSDGPVQSWFTPASAPDATTPCLVTVFTVEVLAGQTVSVNFAAYSGSYTVNTNDGTYLQFISYAATSGGEKYATADGLPQVKASEWFKDLVNRFNLAVVADQEDDRTLIIEPMDDYLLTGTTRDWTGKVDLDEKRMLSPLTPFRKRNVKYSDGVDNDYFNQWYAKQFSMALGDFGFTSTDEFAQGDLNSGMLCGSTGLYPIPTSASGNTIVLTDVVIPHYYATNAEGEAEPTTTKPKLLFYNELVDMSTTLYIGEQSFTQYPHFSPFTDRTIGASTWSLYWRHTFTFYTSVIGDQFAQGLYTRFWQQYMADVYAAEARMLECSVVLDVQDVRTLSFADIIRIQNETYRVLDVRGYNPDDTDKAQVRLLKSITTVAFDNPGRPCDLTQVTSNLDGTTGWEDSAGVAAQPTQECCAAAGFTFHDNKCWWTFHTTGGGNGGPDRYRPNILTQQRSARNTPRGLGPVPLPIVRSSVREIANTINSLLPYADGRATAQTRNVNGATTGAQQRYMLAAITSDGTAEVASPRGVTTRGDGQAMMIAQEGTAMQIRARCVGVDVATNTGTVYGQYSLIEKLFVITSFDGVASVAEDQTVEDYRTGGRSHASVTAQIASSGLPGNPSNLVEIVVDGNEADVITSWMIDVEVTYIDVNNTAAFFDGLLMENGALGRAQNNNQIVTQ